MNNTARNKEDALTLEILEVIENESHVTQRHLADKLGVALGLANSYLKRCMRKGLIKVQQAPANRYLYYITPKGFAEKSRLTARYLSVSFDFYRQAGNSLNNIYLNCIRKSRDRILVCGISELAEIASIRAVEHNIRIVGYYDPLSREESFLRMPIMHELPEKSLFDACLLTAVSEAGAIYGGLAKCVDKDIILVPSILGLNVENGLS